MIKLPRRFGRLGQFLSSISTVIMALILAFIVWLVAVQQENPYERGIFPDAIPLQVRGQLAEDQQTLQDLGNTTVNLSIGAPRRTWETLSATDFSVYVDLDGLVSGSNDVDVQVLPLNPDVDILDVQPERLRIQVEPVISKTVPIQVTLMDSPAVGYDTQPPLVTPQFITVTGPAPQVNQVTFGITEIYLRSARSRVETVTTVSPRNSQNQPVTRVTVEPNQVNVVVPIAQRAGRRTVAVVVEPEGQPADGYTVTNVQVEPATIVLLGSAEALQTVSGFIATPPLSIEGAVETVVERLVLNLPENVTAETDSVQVTVTINPVEATRTIKRQPVIQGLETGLIASVSLESVDVFLSGPVNRLESLSLDEVRAILDVSGLSPGSHVLDVKVVTPEGIRVEGINPQVVEVVIAESATPTPVTTVPAEIRPTGTLTPSIESGTGTSSIPSTTSTTPRAAKTATPTPNPSRGTP